VKVILKVVQYIRDRWRFSSCTLLGSALISFIAGALALFSVCSAHGQTMSSPPLVDSFLDKMSQPGMPGCAVGVVQRGVLTLSRGYGLADVENGVPIGTETRFDIGSMSKQFLGMAVLMLASAGKLNLDGEVHAYVPELPAYPWKITLRDLLHHTSGLKDYDQLLQLAGWVDGDVKSAHDIQWIIERQKSLAFEPGTQYSYSDTNYFLLGLIAQRITSRPLQNLLQQMIFDPLGMSHTSLHTDRWSLCAALTTAAQRSPELGRISEASPWSTCNSGTMDLSLTLSSSKTRPVNTSYRPFARHRGLV
jgi:CubicO group peptidase (beta-lactamase class C family)